MVNYAIIITPLSEADGGGFGAIVPDLPGCMSDGETPEEAALNIQDAIEGWLDLRAIRGFDLPVPGVEARALLGAWQDLQDELHKIATDARQVSPETARALGELLQKSKAFESRLAEAIKELMPDVIGAPAAPAKASKVA